MRLDPRFDVAWYPRIRSSVVKMSFRGGYNKYSVANVYSRTIQGILFIQDVHQIFRFIHRGIKLVQAYEPCSSKHRGSVTVDQLGVAHSHVMNESSGLFASSPVILRKCWF